MRATITGVSFTPSGEVRLEISASPEEAASAGIVPLVEFAKGHPEDEPAKANQPDSGTPPHERVNAKWHAAMLGERTITIGPA